MTSVGNTNAVAVIGLEGRFPGAASAQAYWANIRAGVCSITPGTAASRGYAGRLSDVDLFDADFFGFRPQEAEATDPQHRILLECAWAALEDAGYVGETYPDNIGVFVGASPAWYSHRLYSNPALLRSIGLLHIMLGNDAHFLATRISYKLNLRGPSLGFQSACSTSLVAVHYACQSLLNGECEIALAGGVGLTASCSSALDGDSDIFSHDGAARPFDADAQGTVPGEGAGVVVLKRYADAIRDGDHVRAILLGSAVSNDGANKASFLAPSVEGQSRAIAEALATSGVSARTVTYMEAHGTATAVGDPIEFKALTEAFRSDTGDTQFCTLGSVKANIGHLDAAAGISGLIKCILALEHRMLPGMLHFRRPNPALEVTNSPFRLHAENRSWEEGSHPRRAGINSCGFGGTNVHMILQEGVTAEHPHLSIASGTVHDLPEPWLFSARSAAALQQAVSRFAGWLQKSEDTGDAQLADAAHTLRVGRKTFAHRGIVLTRSRKELLTSLSRGLLRKSVCVARVSLGSLELAREPLTPEVLQDLCSFSEDLSDRLRQAQMALREAGAGLPLGREATILAEQWSLGATLLGWGLKPASIAAGGVSELAAACLAGVMTIQDAARFVLTALHPMQPGLQSPVLNAPSLRILRGDGSAVGADQAHSADYWSCWHERAHSRSPFLPAADTHLHTPTSFDGLLEALSCLWLHGVEVDWNAVYASQSRRRVSLPTYPFERKRYWIEEATPASASAAEAVHARTPQLPLSAQIRKIWMESLGLAQASHPSNTSGEDDFFAAGGDSLVAVQLLSRVRHTFSVAVQLEDFFDQPTLSALEAFIAKAGQTKLRDKALPSRPVIARAVSRFTGMNAINTAPM